MNNNELDKQLAASFLKREKSWAKILSQLKRQFDAWACSQLSMIGYTDFKLSYLPLLMNIKPEGITNNELAKKAMVTKQAMSKVVKELVELNLITTETDANDKRSAIILLTTKGKEFVIMVREKIGQIEQAYEDKLGKETYENMKENLLKIIDLNEVLLKAAPCF